MEIIPAIDIRGGKCVQLYQGKFDRETVFSDDPVDAARRWADQGATRLHVVDLDGARDGLSQNLSTIADIISSVNVPVQVGGGIRSVEAAQAVMSLGADRVIIGTAAVETPTIIGDLGETIGIESVIVGLDAQDGYVAIKGWRETTGVQATELARQTVALGVPRFLYTDISRDGTLTEPNFEALETMIEVSGAHIIASGGISSIAHLKRLSEIGAESAVVGTAIYTGDIDLAKALNAVHTD